MQSQRRLYACCSAAFATTLAAKSPAASEKKFSFVFYSGRGAAQNVTRSLWLFPETRKVRGAAEQGLLDIAEAHPNSFDAFIVRPGGMVPEESRMVYDVVSYAVAPVLVSDLAKVMANLCVDESEQKILENEEIVRRSQSAEREYSCCTRACSGDARLSA